MKIECLQQGFSEVTAGAWVVERDDLVSLIMLSVLLAVGLAPLVLVCYQRRVQLLMNAQSSLGISRSLQENRVAVEIGAAAAERRSKRVAAEELLTGAELRSHALQAALAFSMAVFSVLIALAITISADEPGELSRRTLLEWLGGGIVYLLWVAPA